MTIYNPLSGIAPHFIISLCLTRDDFTRQGESTGVYWIKLLLEMQQSFGFILILGIGVSNGLPSL
jgi:hypothetical protein